jgi:outer membrane protein OmpA-like peptidoglycan-associated protein
MKTVLTITCSLILAFGLFSCNNSKKLTAQHKSDLKDTYETLKREMPEAEVTMSGDRVKVVLPEAVLFKVNEAEINKDYYPIIAKMATVLNKYNKTDVLITGYTDASGSDTYNQQLSKKRADNAKAILVADKIKDSRINVWGFGSKDPIADNKTEEGRKQNRRVEYVIMYDYKGSKK